MIRGVLTTAALAIAAPFVAGVSFVYYVGYKTTKWAFEHPKLAVGTMAGAGLLWYAARSQDWQMRSGISDMIHTLQEKRALSLEQKVQELRRQNLHQQRVLEQQRRYSDDLQRSLEHYKQGAQPQSQQVQPQPPTVQQQAPPPQQLQAIADPQFNFYYVKQGESLSSIASRISGDSTDYRVLQSDNEIQDSSRVLVGQLLRVRKSLCHRDVTGLYAQIPKLRSIVLDSAETISSRFGADTEAVLALNRKLGLQYTDDFPIRNGARIVYFQ